MKRRDPDKDAHEIATRLNKGTLSDVFFGLGREYPGYTLRFATGWWLKLDDGPLVAHNKRGRWDVYPELPYHYPAQVKRWAATVGVS